MQKSLFFKIIDGRFLCFYILFSMHPKVLKLELKASKRKVEDNLLTGII